MQDIFDYLYHIKKDRQQLLSFCKTYFNNAYKKIEDSFDFIDLAMEKGIDVASKRYQDELNSTTQTHVNQSNIFSY